MRHHDPPLRRAVLGRGPFAVEAGLERRVAAAADRGGDEDPIAPDDGAGVREAGQRDVHNMLAPVVGPTARAGAPRRRRLMPMGRGTTATARAFSGRGLCGDAVREQHQQHRRPRQRRTTWISKMRGHSLPVTNRRSPLAS